MENLNIAEMSRDELVRLVAEKTDTLDLDVLKQALDRIDMLDGKEKTEAESTIADINDEAFDDLPIDEQLKKLMKANQAFILSRMFAIKFTWSISVNYAV